MTSIESRISKLEKIRMQSEACWEQAADDPRQDADAREFLEDWNQWGEFWDEAEELLQEGDIDGAAKALDVCRCREEDHGDSTHATRAIRVVRDIV